MSRFVDSISASGVFLLILGNLKAGGAFNTC